MSYEQISDYPRESTTGDSPRETLLSSGSETLLRECESSLDEWQLKEDMASLNVSFAVLNGVLEDLPLVMQQDKEAAIVMQNTKHTLQQCRFTSERYEYCARHTLLCEADSWRATSVRLYPAAVERAQQRVDKQRHKLMMRSVRTVKAVFVAGGAVQLPDWCCAAIPKRTEWQQDKALLPSIANDIYQELVQEAADWAVAQCEQIALDELPQLCHNDEIAICEPENQQLDVLQTKHKALVVQARQLEQSRDEEHAIVPADTLLSFCHYLTEHVPQISQTQIALLQWFDRSDKAITHDMAQRLADHLWPKAAQDAARQSVDMQTEQIIAEAAERLVTMLQAYQPTTEQQVTQNLANTAPYKKRNDIQQHPSNKPKNGGLPAKPAHSRAETAHYLHDHLALPHELVPWLDTERGTIECKILVDDVPGALVIDCRSKALQEIERQMDGYQSTAWDYVSPNVQQRLTHYAQVAMSEGGLIAAGKFSSVDKSSESIYPHPVIYSKDAKHNVMRVYISNLRVSQMDDTLMGVREQLTAMQVHELIMLIGVCDKQHQLATLAEITGRSRRELRSKGAGSV